MSLEIKFFKILQITQDLNKKNPGHSFVDIGKLETYIKVTFVWDFVLSNY